MSHYHARRQPYVRQSQQQRLAQARQRRLWLAGGAGLSLAFVAGYFVAGHFLHGQSRVSQPSPTVFQQQQAESAEESGRQVRTVANQPRGEAPEKGDGISEFSFYHTLPHERVQVDARPLPVKLEQPVVIVAGTFMSEERARREQQRLARLGFDLKVRVRQVKGRTLYQLRTSPLDNKLDVNLLRNRLAQAGARVLVVKARPAAEAQSHP